MSPVHLFKYREINNWTARIITHNELYFAKPQELNDPWDCASRVSFEGATPAQIRDLVHVAMKEALCNLVLSTAKFEEVVERHYREALTDPDGFLRDAERGLRDSIQVGKGVYCLSEVANEAQMWSYYAKGHSGICIDMSLPEILTSARAVRYMGHLPRFNFFDLPLEQLADKVLFTKHNNWSYEHEWRIIQREFPPGAHHFKYPLVKRVIFGAKTRPPDVKLVLGWLKDARLDVPLYQAELDPCQPVVQIRPI